MKLYRVSYYTPHGGTEGYEFFGSKREASKGRADFLAARASDDPSSEIEPVNVPVRKADLIVWLNQHAGHADNG